MSLMLGSARSPWRRKSQPTPVFLPEESHGQRSLVGYSPWGGKESDMTEATEYARMHTSSTCSVNDMWEAQWTCKEMRPCP